MKLNLLQSLFLELAEPLVSIGSCLFRHLPSLTCPWICPLALAVKHVWIAVDPVEEVLRGSFISR